MVATPMIEEIAETFVSVDEDGDFEVIEIKEVFEESADEVFAESVSDEVFAESVSEDAFVDDQVSLETAPISVVDDKTRPIELPEKSDNELF
jgi:hypothetical protein